MAGLPPPGKLFGGFFLIGSVQTRFSARKLAGQKFYRLVDKFREDLGDRLFGFDKPDALPGHHRTTLYVAVDGGAQNGRASGRERV